MKFKNSLILGVLLLSVFSMSVSSNVLNAYAATDIVYEPATTTTSSITITWPENVDIVDNTQGNWTISTGQTVSSVAHTNGTDSTILNLSGAPLATDAIPGVTFIGNGTVVDTSTGLIVPTNSTIISLDGLAPTLDSAKTGPGLDEVTYTFSEFINATSVGGGDFASVGGFSFSGFELNNQNITVSYNGNLTTSDSIPSAERLAGDGVADTPGNPITSSTIVIEDGHAPTLVSVNRTAINTFILEFSEPVVSGPGSNFFTVVGANSTQSVNQTASILHNLVTTGFTANQTGLTPLVTYNQTAGDLADDALPPNLLGDGQSATALDSINPIIYANLPSNSTSVNNVDVIDFDLTEIFQSGTITISESGSGTGDDFDPHTYNFVPGDLSEGNHSITFADLQSGFTNATNTLVDGVEYDIEIDGTDLAGNNATTTTLSFITFDTNDPIFTNLDPLTGSFNKDSAFVTYQPNEKLASGTLNFTHTSNGTDTQGTHIFNLEGTQLTTVFSQILFSTLNNDTSFNATNGLVDGESYTITYTGTDSAGNSGSNSTTNVTYDVSAPTMDSALTTSTTSIEITFSEDLEGTSIETGDFTLPPSITLTNATENNGVVTLTLQDPIATSETPIITLGGDGVVDLAGNLLSNGIVGSTDGIIPTLDSVTTGPGSDQVSYTFSENVTNAEFGDFLTVNEKSPDEIILNFNGTVIVGFNNTIATNFSDNNNNNRFSPSGSVQDTALNILNSTSGDTSSTITDGLAPDMLSAITNSTVNVNVTFSEAVNENSLNAEDFLVGGSPTLSAVSNNSTNVFLTVHQNYTFGTGGIPQITLTNTTGGISDLFGNILELDDTGVIATDGVAPKLDSAKTGPEADEITFTFSENMDNTGTITSGDFLPISGNTVSSIAPVSGANVVVTYNNTFTTFQIYNELPVISGSLNDTNSNILTSATVDVADGLGPLFSATHTSNSTTVVDFTEGVFGTWDIGNWNVGTTISSIVDNLGNSTSASNSTSLTITHSVIATNSTLDVTYLSGNLADVAENQMADNTSATANDSIAPEITTNSPDAETSVNESGVVDYTFSEAMASGTIIFEDANSGSPEPGSPHTYDIPIPQLTSGNHTISIGTLNSDDPFTSNGTLVDGIVYNITIVGDDTSANSAIASKTNNVTFDTTAPGFSSLAPLTGSFNNQESNVSYILNETAVSGTIKFTHTSNGTDNNSPHVLVLPSGSEGLDAGSHSLTFAQINGAFTADEGAEPLVDGESYTIGYNATDQAGNSLEVSTTNVTFDITPPTFTLVGPATNSENNNEDFVTYTLPEDLSSGVISFAFNGNGTTDNAGIRNYTLGAPQLLANSSQAISFSELNDEFTPDLVDGAFYDITYVGNDLAGNNGIPVTTNNVKYDTTAPLISNVTMISNNLIDDGWAKDGDNITISFTGNELLTVITSTINLQNATVLNNGTTDPEIQKQVDGTILEGGVAFSIIATDPAGNESLEVVAVSDGTAVIVDKTAPIVTGSILGINATQTTELTTEDNYVESCEASDLPNAVPDACTVLSGGIDTTILGFQQVVYQALDLAGNNGTDTVSTTVSDSNPPFLEPISISSTNLFNSTFATVGDTITVSITGDEFLTFNGTITINDQTGEPAINNATTINATRLVTEADTEGPATFDMDIQDPSNNTLMITESNITDETAIIVDTTNPTFEVIVNGTRNTKDFSTLLTFNVTSYTQGNITAQADANGIFNSTIGGDIVNDNALGNYNVTYTVIDNAGNDEVITESVTVGTGDFPVLALNGNESIDLQVQGNYTELGANVTDTEDDADPTRSIDVIISGDTVNPSAGVGTVFNIFYDATDSSGNNATQLTRTVTLIDTTIPIISLKGESITSISLNAVYDDAGATAWDIDDGNLTSSIIITGLPVNTTSIGQNFVNYNVKDSQNNTATQVIRTVNVIQGFAPVITVTGGDITFKLGGVYTEQGAVCFDEEDGELVATTSDTIDQLSIGVQTVTYSCIDASNNETQETRTVTIQPKSGGGKDNPKSAPTSGLDWNTSNLLVDNGIVVNGKPYNIDDNWHTDFVLQTTSPGKPNTFSTKTYAQNGGLAIHEIAFGVPGIGNYHDAEALIEVYYNYDKTIEEVRVIQDTEVVEESSLVVTTDQVKCRADSDAQCYQTNFKVTFREPLQDDVFAIKSIDMSRRSMMPTYLNDGLMVNGESLNPAKTLMIPGPEKYEGLIEITQSQKYSDLWFAADGRIFEMYGESDSIRLVQQETLQRIDSGKVDNRNHSGYADYKVALAEEYKKIFDSSKLQKLVPESFAYAFPDVDSRTQFLIDNGLLKFVRDQ